MNNFVGLDITKHILRVAVVTASKDVIIVDKMKEKIIDGNLYKPSSEKKHNQLADELIKISKALHFKNDKVIYSDFGYNLLVQQVLIKIENHPKKMKEHIFMELGESIQVPFDNPTFDILSIQSSTTLTEEEEADGKKKKRHKKNNHTMKTEQDVNIVVANETDLVYVGDAIVTSKNLPYGVDMSAMAFHRLLTYFEVSKIKRNMYLLLELNCGEAVMTVMYKGLPVYTQYQEYNPDHWKVNYDALDEGSQSHDIWLYDDVYEANKMLSLIDSANRLIDTFSHMYKGASIKHVYLVGENPLVDEGITDFLSHHLEVSVIKPKLNIIDKKGKKLPSRYYKSVGLAMKKEEFK